MVVAIGRRRFLATIAGVGVAGASGCVTFSGDVPPGGYDLLTHGTDEGLEEKFVHEESEFAQRHENVVADLTENGTSERVGKRFVDGEVVRANGSTYRVERTELGTETHEVTVFTRKAVDDMDDWAVEPDRFDGHAERIVTGIVEGSGEYPLYPDESLPDQLSPEPEHRYVHGPRDVYRIEAREAERELTRYRYTWTELRSDEEVREAITDAEYSEPVAIVTEGRVSDGVYDILETAVEEGSYTAEYELSGAERRVLELLEVELHGGGTTAWMEFEGTLYRVSVREWAV